MLVIVGVLLVAGIELIFWGWYLYRWDRVWFVLCCILLVSSFGLDYGVG